MSIDVTVLKPGDRVRAKDSSGTVNMHLAGHVWKGIKRGKFYTVTKTHNDSVGTYIELSEDPQKNNQWHPDWFDMIEPAEPPKPSLSISENIELIRKLSDALP